MLLHGLFGDAGNLRALGRRLEAAPGGTRRTLRFDLPGHGGRPAPATLDQGSLARAIAADLRAALHDDPGPLHLLGHSLGGKVAMVLAGLSDGPPLASLTVLDIAPRAYPPHHDRIIAALRGLTPAALGARRDADAALAADIPDAATRAFLLKGLEALPGGGYRWRFDLEAIARDRAHLAAEPPPGPPPGSPPGSPVTVPALFLYGERSDYVDPVADAETVRARFPNARFEGVAGAGHWLHAERADLVAGACARHLERADAACARA